MEDSPAVLLERWKGGDQSAAEALYRRYAQRLWGLAEANISRKLARRVEADDIVQSVFRTFFRRKADAGFPIDHSGALWRLLVQITLHKVRKHAERHRAQKRDLNRELPGDALAPEAVAHDPTPAEAVALVEMLEGLQRSLSPRDQDVIRLCLHGYGVSDVAAQVGCSRWTVRRVLDHVGRQLQQALEH